MKIVIEYCVACGYERRAQSLAALIKAAKGVDPEFVEAGGGVFEVYKDGALVFSKKALGRFPFTEQEVVDELD